MRTVTHCKAHVYKEGNIVADATTNEALKYQNEIQWEIEMFPSWIKDIIFQ